MGYFTSQKMAVSGEIYLKILGHGKEYLITYNRLKHRGVIEDLMNNLQQWFHLHTGGCLLGIVKPADGTKGFQVQQ